MAGGGKRKAVRLPLLLRGRDRYRKVRRGKNATFQNKQTTDTTFIVPPSLYPSFAIAAGQGLFISLILLLPAPPTASSQPASQLREQSRSFKCIRSRPRKKK